MVRFEPRKHAALLFREVSRIPAGDTEKVNKLA